MKTLNQFIIEKFKFGKNQIKTYKYCPESKFELMSLIKDEYFAKGNGDLSDIDVSKINSFTYLFQSVSKEYKETIKEVNISGWNFSGTLDISGMFSKTKFQKIILNRCDTSNIKEMAGLFANSFDLEYIEGLDTWNVSKVRSMNEMFYNCDKLNTIEGLENWNTKSMIDCTKMFDCCYGLEDIGDISNWNMENVKYISYIFYNCENLKDVGDITKWNLESIKTYEDMFYNSGISIDLNTLLT